MRGRESKLRSGGKRLEFSLVRSAAKSAWTALACAAALVPGEARAETPPFELVWDAPGECPSRAALEHAVASLLGSGRSVHSPARVRAAVTHENLRWHADVELRDPEGTASPRRFDAENCEAVASAVALIVAVAIDGRDDGPTAAAVPAVAAQSPALPASAASTPSVPPAAPRAAAVPVPAERAAASPALAVPAATRADTSRHADRREATETTKPTAASSGPEVSFAAMLDALLPAASPGGEFAVGWTARFSTWRLGAHAGASFFAPEDVNGADSERGTFWHIDSFARACGAFVTGAVEVGPCVGGEVDTVFANAASGPAFLVHEPKVVPFAALTGSAWASVDVTPHVAIFARADAILLLDHPIFVVDRAATNPAHVYQLPVAAPRGAMGVTFRFF